MILPAMILRDDLKPARGARPGARRPAALLAAASLAGALALAGCSSAPVPAFDLAAPREGLRGSYSLPGQLVVNLPVALSPFDSERIIVKDAGGSLSYLGGGQWSDQLPRLIQSRLVATFENATRAKTVSRPGEGVNGDYQLNTAIRAFQLDGGRGEVVVELSEKLVAVTTGKIVRARVFAATIPVSSPNAGEVATALDRAMSTVFVDIVRWTAGGR